MKKNIPIIAITFLSKWPLLKPKMFTIYIFFSPKVHFQFYNESEAAAVGDLSGYLSEVSYMRI